MLFSCLFRSLSAAVVYDPDEVVIKNIALDIIFIQTEDELKLVAKTGEAVMLFLASDLENDMDLSGFGGVVSKNRIKKLKDRETNLRFFEGHYKTMRFAFPSNLKSPVFYNVKGEKFEYPAYKRMFDQVCMSMGMGSLVTPSGWWMYAMEPVLDGNEYFIHAEEYIFTKQANIFKVDGKDVLEMEKIADAEQGMEKLHREANVLHALAPILKQDVVSIPTVSSFGKSLILSNNYPNGAEMTDQLEDLHLMALGAIYDADTNITSVSRFLDDNNYINLIKAFKLILNEELHPNGLSKQHLEEIAIDIMSLYGRLRGKSSIYTSLYHGAFTPQNCLKKDGVLYLNNFEKSERDKPLLFDAFHYIFHQVEQNQVPTMGELDDIMKHLFKNKKLMSLIEKHEINFKLNLCLFHVHHIINKIEAFLRQKFINPNVNFTLQFYKQALERMNHVEL